MHNFSDIHSGIQVIHNFSEIHSYQISYKKLEPLSNFIIILDTTIAIAIAIATAITIASKTSGSIKTPASMMSSTPLRQTPPPRIWSFDRALPLFWSPCVRESLILSRTMEDGWWKLSNSLRGKLSQTFAFYEESIPMGDWGWLAGFPSLQWLRDETVLILKWSDKWWLSWSQ